MAVTKVHMPAQLSPLILVGFCITFSITHLLQISSEEIGLLGSVYAIPWLLHLGAPQ
jgi:hypothetical protein